MAGELIIAESFNDINIRTRTEVDTDSAIDATVLNVVNASEFSSGDYILVGFPGGEYSEIRKISSISDNAITVTSAFDLPHMKDDYVYKIAFNQVKFYRATNVDGTRPDDADFAELAAVDLVGDETFVSYADSVGGSGYWYLYTFYNSDTTGETSLANATAVRGGNYGQYSTVEGVREEAGLLDNEFISDARVKKALLQATDEVKSALIKGGYVIPLDDIPPMIENIVELLAAGYLLITDYGSQFDGTNKQGNEKLDRAQRMLKDIRDSNVDLVLSDEAVASGQNKVSGIPDCTTEPERFFTTDQTW